MVKVVLHIGTHKTATTLIQDVLANNRKILKDNNIIYPTIGLHTGHHMVASEWISMKKQYNPIKGNAKIWAHIEKTYANTDKTIVLSSEEFSRAGPTKVDMKQLRQKLSFADSVEVVCFLRDQRSFLQSIYLEIAKKCRPTDPTQIHKNALKNHSAAGLYLNYNDLYDELLRGFSKSEITFIPFSETHAHDGGILGFFLNHIGYEPSYNTLSLEKADPNISSDALTAWVAGAISAPEAPSEYLLGTARAILFTKFGTPLKTSLFTPAEIQELKNEFDPLNQILKERISDTQPHFNLPPITYDEKLPHRKDIGLLFWIRLRLRLVIKDIRGRAQQKLHR